MSIKLMLMSSVLLLLLLLFACNGNRKRTDSISKDVDTSYDKSVIQSFEYHFRILDSVQAASIGDTIYVCCSPSIKFMEISTGVATSEDGNLFGKIAFSNNDLQNWHGWYDKRHSKKSTNK